MVEEMVAMAENDAASRGGIQAHQRYADRHYQRRPQSFIAGSASRLAGTEEGRHTGDIADEPENKPSLRVIQGVTLALQVTFCFQFKSCSGGSRAYVGSPANLKIF
jgi:hypothetical protein